MSAVHPLPDLHARVGRRRAVPPELVARPGLAAELVAAQRAAPAVKAVAATPVAAAAPEAPPASTTAPRTDAAPAHGRSLAPVLGRIALVVGALCSLVVLMAALGGAN